KLCTGRKILQITGQIAAGRRKLREHAAAFVSRFAQARRVLVKQGLLERCKMLREARRERLTHFPEQHWITAARGQQHRRVDQAPLADLARGLSSEDPGYGRHQLGGTDRLGLEIIHAGCETALAILFPGARRQGDDWQVSSRGRLPLPNCPYNLKSVQLRHVNVQENQVKTPLFRQSKHFSAVTRYPHTMSLPDECLFQDLRA